MQPHLAFSVDNKLSDDPNAGQVKVDLHFESMDDFSPENVAQQVKPLKELLDLRTRSSDLRGSLQGNDKLDDMLFDAVSSTEAREKLKGEIDATKEVEMSELNERAAAAALRPKNNNRINVLCWTRLLLPDVWTATPQSLERGQDLVKEFVSQVLDGHMTLSATRKP